MNTTDLSRQNVIGGAYFVTKNDRLKLHKIRLPATSGGLVAVALTASSGLNTDPWWRQTDFQTTSTANL